ncbi:MAG TPA: helix-turn-helix domain-containing protein [Candidatus Nanoarchaeia archaeon]|nr:helix-turn-helix domain-containing protein [Candidatus Nanoarchaeia archaeon]
MWNLKCKVRNSDSVYTSLTASHNIIDYFYPVDRYKKGNKIYILGIHTLEGTEKEQDRFIREINKKKKVKKLKRDHNKIVLLVAEEEKFYELLYNPELYFPSPTIVKEGYEYWSIAAWDRTILEELIKEMGKWKDKLHDFTILKLQKTGLKEVYFPKIKAKLPEKQKEAFHLALKNGYYQFPRSIDLEQLAQKMHIATSTYHEHLRKAEARLLPFFADDVK